MTCASCFCTSTERQHDSHIVQHQSTCSCHTVVGEASLADLFWLPAGDDWDNEEDDETEHPGTSTSAAMQGERLQSFASNLVTREMSAALSEAQSDLPGAHEAVLATFARVRGACKKVSSAVARQIRDRVGGRFFLPDIIEAAQSEPSDPDYMSEEDNIAIYEHGKGGRCGGFSFATVERLSGLVARANSFLSASCTSWTLRGSCIAACFKRQRHQMSPV